MGARVDEATGRLALAMPLGGTAGDSPDDVGGAIDGRLPCLRQATMGTRSICSDELVGPVGRSGTSKLLGCDGLLRRR